MKKAPLLIGLLFFTATILVIADAHLSEFNVYSNSSGNVVVEWKTSYESDVSKFIIERKTDQTNWDVIANIAPKGAGYTYTFTDQSAYKTSDITFSYRLGVQSASTQQVTYMEESSINPKISGIKQTWGMIKAMFR